MRLPGLATLILLVPILSGCLDSEPPSIDDVIAALTDDASLICFDDTEIRDPARWLDGLEPQREGYATTETCNLLATVSPFERQANELSIAVNPRNPMNIIASGKDYNPTEAGDCVWDGIYTSFDGGRTWFNQNLAGSNWRRMAEPDYPTHPEFSKFWCATDPVVAFAPDGTAYWTVMPYQCDRISGSKTGRGVHEDGGFNDWFWTCSSMYVLRSDDGGITWPVATEVAFGPRLEHDKQWLSIGPDGTILLCWDRAQDYLGIERATGQDNPASQLENPGNMVCATSRDRAETFTAPKLVNEDWPGFLPWVDWGPDGVAWMAAIDGSDVLVSSSRDGLNWAQPIIVGNYTNPPRGGEYGWPVLDGSDFRMFALPSLAVDRSDGPHKGTVHVTWFDHSRGQGDILVTSSADGTNWSTPQRVHDDGDNSTTDQFMPAVSVGPDGTVDLIWYDRRDDPDNHLFDLYYAYSLDGGATWSKNLRVSDVSSDEQYSHHQNGMIFLGDYIDLDSSEGIAHAVWVDTRQGKADVFIAHIERPSVTLIHEDAAT